ncbi:F-type H+-transporting ATPase subunit b [Pseudobutyrivibrio sp. YE44]|uniref:F0F1 ATP synthase subunit B n=1 Tax=Pseudobutyrivibrio sp. YE44 TaxID=1520802 RepID=UPI00088422B2|nr:F0F1 ATP synthase subunit B [Pseudobutyrivibrio sp. YE44]SDB21972.1 F-type H+-transporting ATPase subunit b [Pseudobutyrivibrio sp. YE44]
MINVSFWNILWTVVNLLLLCVAFKFFFFKRIDNIIVKRQEEAKEIYDKAEEKNRQADEYVKKYEDKLASVESEKKQIILEARKTADGQYQKIIAEAHEDAKNIHENAVAEATIEKNKIISSAKKEIADMVVEATAKVIGSRTGADIDSQLFDDFIDKAGE